MDSVDHPGEVHPRLPSVPKISSGMIQEIRESLGMTRLEFGKVFGRSDDYIYRWEKGRYEPTGAEYRLLDLIRRHGLSYVLD